VSFKVSDSLGCPARLWNTLYSKKGKNTLKWPYVLLYSDVHDQLPPPPFSECSKILNSVRASNLASSCSERLWLHARTILVAMENYSGWLGELSWLARGVELKQLRTCLAYASSTLRFLFLSFAYASTKRECNAVSTIADESWQYRRGGNLTILTKITTLQKQSSCSQAYGFATITMYSWWQPGEIGCAYRI
jgi:hypothetical protein